MIDRRGGRKLSSRVCRADVVPKKVPAAVLLRRMAEQEQEAQHAQQEAQHAQQANGEPRIAKAKVAFTLC